MTNSSQLRLRDNQGRPCFSYRARPYLTRLIGVRKTETAPDTLGSRSGNCRIVYQVRDKVLLVIAANVDDRVSLFNFTTALAKANNEYLRRDPLSPIFNQRVICDAWNALHYAFCAFHTSCIDDTGNQRYYSTDYSTDCSALFLSDG